MSKKNMIHGTRARAALGCASGMGGIVAPALALAQDGAATLASSEASTSSPYPLLLAFLAVAVLLWSRRQ